ncbi:kinase-like domain-containing protein [Chytriomyces sp. MP71]|nr:kinase-like domain-containing protein [Chytriomyces sp. MP71]
MPYAMPPAPPSAVSPRSKQAPPVVPLFTAPNLSDFSKASSPLPPPSPKSSLSSLLASQRLVSASSSALSSPSVLSDIDSDFVQPQPQSESTVDEDDPVIAFRIRNYSAVEDEGVDREDVDEAVKPIPIWKGSTPPRLGEQERPTPSHKKMGPDDFERLRVIGQGGYGKVFQVRKRETKSIYAMKVLKKATLVIHTKTVEHTKNERSILSYIMLLKLQTSCTLLCSMLRVASCLVSWRIKECLTRTRLRSNIGELLLALVHLHGRGIIYRDLKPESVLLIIQGYGDGSKVALETKTICGTIEFTAPEVLEENLHSPCLIHPQSSQATIENMEDILKNKLTHPPYLTSYAKDLLTKLLRKDPAQRIGSGPKGAAEIQAHGYFRKLNWLHLAAREIEPPITPDVAGSLDTSNFDACFTGMALESPPVPGRGGAWPATVAADASDGMPTKAAGTQLAVPDVAASSGASTPTQTNKKKKHRKKAEKMAAVAALAAASDSGRSSPMSVASTIPALGTLDLDAASEAGDVATPLVGAVPIASGETGNVDDGEHHFHGFSYVADDGFHHMQQG